jgi:hypothetical protein
VACHGPNGLNLERRASGEETKMGNGVMYLWMFLLIAPAALAVIDKMRT